jgi:hypothetical protein
MVFVRKKASFPGEITTTDTYRSQFYIGKKSRLIGAVQLEPMNFY